MKDIDLELNPSKNQKLKVKQKEKFKMKEKREFHNDFVRRVKKPLPKKMLYNKQKAKLKNGFNPNKKLFGNQIIKPAKYIKALKASKEPATGEITELVVTELKRGVENVIAPALSSYFIDIKYDLESFVFEEEKLVKELAEVNFEKINKGVKAFEGFLERILKISSDFTEILKKQTINYKQIARRIPNGIPSNYHT